MALADVDGTSPKGSSLGLGRLRVIAAIGGGVYLFWWPDRAVEVAIHDGLVATGDSTLLGAVLDNLLNNA